MTAGRAAAPAALLAALVLAALAAGNAPVLGEAGRQVDRAARAGAVALVIVTWIALLAAGIAAGVAQRIRRAGDPGASHAPWYKRLAAVAGTTALICLAMSGGLTVNHLLGGSDPRAVDSVPQGRTTPEPTATPDPTLEQDPPPAWMVALLLAACASGIAIAYRRLKAPPAATGGPDELDLALGAALQALGPPVDDRDAVLAAYAAMERELGAAGVRRSASEAPREYLARVLRHGRPHSAAPARRLTGLFEHARFSPDPVTAADRAGAEAALAELRRPVAGGRLP